MSVTELEYSTKTTIPAIFGTQSVLGMLSSVARMRINFSTRVVPVVALEVAVLPTAAAAAPAAAAPDPATSGLKKNRVMARESRKGTTVRNMPCKSRFISGSRWPGPGGWMRRRRPSRITNSSPPGRCGAASGGCGCWGCGRCWGCCRRRNRNMYNAMCGY